MIKSLLTSTEARERYLATLARERSTAAAVGALPVRKPQAMKGLQPMMIIKSEETYATVPDGIVPLGWSLVRNGFTTQEEAQQWLWDAIDSIPEGWGLP